jgi:hypothetical protein
MTAYCSLTYLFSFTAKELGLSEDASPAEIEAAAEIFMEKITDFITANTGFIHNDCEISVS